MLKRLVTSRAKWNPNEVYAQFEREGIPLVAAFRDFQEMYAGIQFFLPAMQLPVGFGLEPSFNATCKGLHRVLCGMIIGISVPAWFYVREDGVICAEDIPIARSIELLLESEAVGQEMLDAMPTWNATYFNTVQRTLNFQERIDFPVIREASDEYGSWWSDEDVYIQRSAAWCEPEKEQWRVFAIGESELKHALRRIRNQTGLEGFRLGPWPYHPLP